MKEKRFWIYCCLAGISVVMGVIVDTRVSAFLGLIAVFLLPIVIWPVKSVKRIVMTLYGYQGACWWIGYLGAWTIVMVLVADAEYPIGVLLGLGISTSVLFPAIIWPLGRKFVVRADDDKMLIVINDELEVAEFGECLWKNQKYTYSNLPIYLCERKTIFISREIGNFSVTIPIKVSLEPKNIQHDRAYYNDLYHIMPETGLMGYFKGLIEAKFAENESQILSLIFDRSVREEPLEEKVIAFFELNNPFHQFVEVKISIDYVEISPKNVRASRALPLGENN